MHSRFVQQARWTEDLRRYLFSLAEIKRASSILEVGCGTGAVLSRLPVRADQSIYGIDIDYAHLTQADDHSPSARFAQADAFNLPFTNHCFDIVYCHYLLLWLRKPQFAVAEMFRVCKPGGWVLAVAEPDYGGRIDYPQSLETLGRLQAVALTHQGAEPNTGRRVFGLFNFSGFREVLGGVMGGQWSQTEAGDWLAEWDQLKVDLADDIPSDELQRSYEIELQSRTRGDRILFVPTFYAAGRK